MIRGGWFINLPASKDRRARIEAEAARLPFPLERFEAFGPATIPERIAARFAGNTFLGGGEQGCFASHLGVLEKVAAAPDGFHLVLEDDVTLTGDFAAIARDLDGWDGAPEVIRLENPLKCPGLAVRAGPGYAYVRPLRIPNSSAGYLATPRGARRILDLAWEVDIPYDQFLRAVGRADVDMLVCSPPPIRPIDADSTIGPKGRGGRRGRYRGSGFSPGREWRAARRFGAVDLLRLGLAFARMRAAGVRLDVAGDYILPPREPQA